MLLFCCRSPRASPRSGGGATAPATREVRAVPRVGHWPGVLRRYVLRGTVVANATCGKLLLVRVQARAAAHRCGVHCNPGAGGEGSESDPELVELRAKALRSARSHDSKE
jgi:hypothetical protein